MGAKITLRSILNQTMTHRNKKNKTPKKFRFEFTEQIRDFFSGEIPESWEEAHYQMQVENIICARDLYLMALSEQEDKNK